MKLVKMSLAAAVLLGTSAFAIDNIKLSGDAKILYTTDNQEYTVYKADGTTADHTDSGLFDKAASAADVALRISATGDLTKGVSFGLTGYAVSTLGLENNLVDGVWDSAHSATGDPSRYGAAVNDQSWMGEAWVAATLGKTTAKLGRMELDTPFAFSEKWSSTPNTFEGAVLINQDLPDTTLVAAWVGKGNGVNALGNTYDAFAHSILDPLAGTMGVPAGIAAVDLNLGAMNAGLGTNVVGTDGTMNTFANSGAYAVALVNNSFKPLTAQAWYYNVDNIADAYWLQGDIDCQMVKGVKIGAQYANMSPKGLLEKDLALLDTVTGNALNLNDDTSAYAFKLGYEGVQDLKLSASYSKVSDDGALKVANVGTDNLAGAQSKLYTEAWWNYGYVGAPGARSYGLNAEYNAGIAKIAAQYTDVNIERTGMRAATGFSSIDMKEIALTVSKSFGPLDTTLAYISTDADDQNIKGTDTSGTRYDTIQAYLTLNF